MLWALKYEKNANAWYSKYFRFFHNRSQRSWLVQDSSLSVCLVQGIRRGGVGWFSFFVCLVVDSRGLNRPHARIYSKDAAPIHSPKSVELFGPLFNPLCSVANFLFVPRRWSSATAVLSGGGASAGDGARLGRRPRVLAGGASQPAVAACISADEDGDAATVSSTARGRRRSCGLILGVGEVVGRGC